MARMIVGYVYNDSISANLMTVRQLALLFIYCGQSATALPQELNAMTVFKERGYVGIGKTPASKLLDGVGAGMARC